MSITRPVPGTAVSVAGFGGPVADEMNTLLGAWIDWSSNLVIAGTTTNPSKGNSTYSARYVYVGAHTVVYTVNITIGSTFSVGSGVYFFNVPVTPADPSGAAYGAIGPWWTLDSGTANRTGICNFSGNKIQLIRDGASGPAGSASPQTWATSDTIGFTITYEV